MRLWVPLHRSAVGRCLELLAQPVAQHGVDPDAELDLRAEHLRLRRSSHLGPHLLEGGELLVDVHEVALLGRLPVGRVQ